MKALLVENEPLILETIKSLLNSFCPEVALVGEASSIKEAVQQHIKLKPELVFLDIELNDGLSTEYLSVINAQGFDPMVVFMTAHSGYAISTHGFNSLGYLLKPVDPIELTKVVAKASERKRRLPNAQAEDLISFRTQESIEVVKMADILYCRAEGAYSIIVTKDNELLVSKHLKDIEQELPSSMFIRAHHKYLVNVNHILRYNRLQSSSLDLSNGTSIPVSIRKKEELISRITF